MPGQGIWCARCWRVIGVRAVEKYQFPADQLALLEGMEIPFAIYQFIDKHVVTLVLSQGFCKLFGYEDRAQAYHDMDHDMYKDTHPDDVARIADVAFRFATEESAYEVVYRTKMKDSSGYRVVHAMGKHVYTESGERLAHVWYTDEGTYFEDTAGQRSELSRVLSNALHEESLVRASNYDYLTGLPSMTYFFELAEAARESMVARGENPALLYMDLSGMKFFNAKYGFAAGDELLKEFAKVLVHTFGSECCCRIGGDHFAAFSKGEGLEDVLRQFFEDYREANGGKNLPVRVGIYLDGTEGARVSIACDRAKFACDSLHNSYESGFNYYDSRLRDELELRRHVLTHFDRALEEGWIKVYYQAIVGAVNGRVCDEEALSRWVDPKKGMLSPIEFIPALEDAGLIYKLDLYMVDRVLEKMKLQEAMGAPVVPHSINLSRSDFETCDIVEEIRKRVDDSGFARTMITIEITESMIGNDFGFMKEQVDRFRSLGFPVWMDDFGSGYSSLEVLQTIQFDLIKFDMSFMQRLDEGESTKILLTELMKMATSLGVDTVCEGVETEAQVRFLQEIGCSKMQGYYFSKPIPMGTVFERYENGTAIGFQNPEESDYYGAIARVNLYDLAVIASGEDDEGDTAFQNFFNTLPMGIMEVRGDQTRCLRSNPSYRVFIERFFGLDLSGGPAESSASQSDVTKSFSRLVERCRANGGHAFFNELMPDGSTVHSFVRRIGVNAVTGATALAVAVLSIEDAGEGMTYASIARALAADYYNLYYVDVETERFIEYTSTVGGEELAMERRGESFFAAARRDALERIYKEDQEAFAAAFTKENVLRELDEQGTFTITYRLIDDGRPLYANMKIMRMQPDGQRLIIGISIIDSQMKQKAELDRIRSEQAALARVMALSGDYLVLYTVDPESYDYMEYSAMSDIDSFGFAKQGRDFFSQSIVNGEKIVHPDDLQVYKEHFTEDNVMRALDERGSFQLQYRLLMDGREQPVILKIARVRESGGDRLIAGVRIWRDRM